MLSDFLNTTIPKEELATTLKVLREFKAGENYIDWIGISFDQWVVLDDFEKVLEFLVEGKKSKVVRAMLKQQKELANGNN